jgi:photosystem II stability/assembly factor-like uncharacterized protein
MFRRSIVALFLLIIFFTGVLFASSRPKPTPFAVRQKAFELRKQMQAESLFRNLRFRCVGPVVMSGRVVDIEPHPRNPYAFFVAYATGGVWKTSNNGLRYTPIFEGQNAVTIGDIAVDPRNPDIIWVGTGEKNSQRSSYAGTGVYKTTDGGKTWQFVGLGETHHIGRIVIHPENSDIVFVAAMGRLYTPNPDRGVYRSKDGGKSWEKVLYVNERTGFIDLAIDPKNPDVIYAAAWERERRAWNFVESGEGSGIYKSTDGGDTWQKLSGGFPQGKHVGRIGLAIYPQNPQIIYAIVDNQAPRPPEDQVEYAPLTAKKLVNMSLEEFLSFDNDEIENFLRRIGLHRDYTAEIVREMLQEGELTLNDLVQFIRKNNPHAFDPVIIGAEVYRSDDGGKTWRKMNENYIDSFYSTYGYYFGEIRVAPHDDQRIYILGVPLLVSYDGGRHFEWIGARNVHVDHHALWIDPRYPDHLILGNDGGLNVTYDGGKSWLKLAYVPVGQFYTVEVDMAKPYNIYGGLQDNGVYKGSSRSRPLEGPSWKPIMGGDGMYVQVDPVDNTVYTGFQFGVYYRIDGKTGQRKRITPLPGLKDIPLRYNWTTPILLSKHNRNVLYFGANRLFRSMDRGDSWEPISPDLTTQPDYVGDVPYGTITTISESPFRFGMLYVGTDDGRVHFTPDGGLTWKDVGKNLPREVRGLWCSRIVASMHDEATAYVTFTGYRNDDFRAFVFRTRDYGKSWESIRGNLPDESINVIREDPLNPHVLYVGTDMGVFVSLDDGESWQVLQAGLPIVPVHDMVIHPRDYDLVVATHGRSIFVMDVEPIQHLTPEVMRKPVHLFDIPDVREKRSWSSRWPTWRKPPKDSVQFYYWLARDGEVQFRILDRKGRVLAAFKHKGVRGVNTAVWDFQVDRETALKIREEELRKKLEAAEKKLKAAEEKQKAENELRNLRQEVTRAKYRLQRFLKEVEESRKLAHLPPRQFYRRFRPTAITAGEYTVEIRAGDAVHSVKWKILPPRRRGPSKERQERNKEWKKEKKKRALLKQYRKKK